MDPTARRDLYVHNSPAARSVPATFPPQVVLKALRAALTARSTSSLEAWATLMSFSPVAGLTVSKVSPLTGSTHSLLLRGV